ncbi:pseudouridine synthase [Aureococcus anophagefferens]|uniref:Pseudouridine synthase n=1 Tax=Aureococcus anophagefferens TaxID=44056 RepID=A0ABR1FPV4_AURAN
MSGFRGVRKSIARATGVHNAFSAQQKDVDSSWVIEEGPTPARAVRKSVARATGLHNAFSSQQKDVDASWVVNDGREPPAGVPRRSSDGDARKSGVARGVRKSLARATGVHNAFSVQQKHTGAWVVEEHKTPETPVVHDDEELHVLNTAEPEFDGRDRCGFTNLPKRPFTAPPESGTWCDAGAAGLFNVRQRGYDAPPVGRNETIMTKLLELKKPSEAAVYDVVHVDIVTSPAKKEVDVVKHALRPPKPGRKSPLEGLVPSILVLNVIVPALKGDDDDGACHQLCVTCELSAWAHAELARTAPKHGYGQLNLKLAVNAIEDPALRLWATFCRDARREARDAVGETRSRFKLFCGVPDAETLPSLLRPYNARPLLVREPGQIYFHDGFGDVAGFDVDGFKFHPAQRLAVHTVAPSFQDRTVNVAVAVEARHARELPERLLAAVQLRGVGREHGKQFEWWTKFAKPRRNTA